MDDFWSVIKQAATIYARGRGKSEAQVKVFIDWLWRKYELGANEDLPKRRWEYQKQKEMQWNSNADKSLGENE